MSPLQRLRTRPPKALVSGAAGVGRLVRDNLRWSRIRNFLPWVNVAAVRRRRSLVLEPYIRQHSWARELAPVILVPALCLFCLIYGFMFALSAPYLMLPFLGPPAVLLVVAIWALPNQKRAPTWGIEFFFLFYYVLLALWPDYLAFHFPSMPWINSVRLTIFPMVAVLLVSLSVSSDFRKATYKSVTQIRWVWYFICGWIFAEYATIVLSPTPFSSLQMSILATITNFCVFVVAALLFRRIEYIERYWGLLCVLAIPLCILTIFEANRQHLLWMTNVPGFLRPPDESVTKILTPTFRPGINLYRAKGVFRTSLVLAEYLSLLTPFLLHFGLTGKRWFVRFGSFAMIPLIFFVIRLTDSRLGMVGMLVSILMFGCFWSYIRWRREPSNLLSAAILFAYPATFCLAVGAVLSSTRLSIMVFGGGAQASSTAARGSQLGMAMEALMKHPLGHGPGQSGEAMGFAPGAFVTVDNFFITIAMDLGFPGIICWYGMFIVAILTGVRYCLSPEYSKTREATLIGPLVITLSAFLVVKWVHGQGDLHAIQFMELGMLSALVGRIYDRNRKHSRQGLDAFGQRVSATEW